MNNSLEMPDLTEQIKQEEQDDLDKYSDQLQLSQNINQSQPQERIKKRYSVITPEVRKNFIDRILQRQVTIRAAALEFGIKFSTAKAILQIFKKEGRYTKKQTRITKNKAKEPMKTMPIVLKNIQSNNSQRKESDCSNSQEQNKEQYKQPQTYTIDQEMKKTIQEMVTFLDQSSLFVPLKSGDKNLFSSNSHLYVNITINNHLNPFKSNDFNTCFNNNTPYNNPESQEQTNTQIINRLKALDIEQIQKKLRTNNNEEKRLQQGEFTYDNYFQT